MTEKEVWDFVLEFQNKNGSLIEGLVTPHLIQNRYSVEDVKQYISLRIAEILTRRSKKNSNPIKNPHNYFRSCLSYYCREFRREHGYTVGLPRWPLKYREQEDMLARSRKYKYLDLLSADEYLSLTWSKEHNPDPGPLWHQLTGLLTHDQAQVIDCILRRGMTWVETSAHLGIPQSTCWPRKQQAFAKIFDAIDTMSGETKDILRDLLRDNEDL